jgi:hypothetical protein
MQRNSRDKREAMKGKIIVGGKPHDPDESWEGAISRGIKKGAELQKEAKSGKSGRYIDPEPGDEKLSRMELEWKYHTPFEGTLFPVRPDPDPEKLRKMRSKNAMAETLQRGLSPDFVSALSTAYDKSPWWKAIVDDRELFVTPRKTCVCVYYRGNRLLKLSLKDRRLVGEIHYKYLLNPDLKPAYRNVTDGKVGSLDGMGAFVSDFSNIKLLKRASKPYAGNEKYGVSKIIAENLNIIDAEVAFSDSGHSAEDDDDPPEETVDDKSHHSPRIDFVAVQADGKRLKLVFFEAKYFTNHELKSGGDPRVFEQIAKYEKLLKKYEKENDIGKAYKQHCEDMLRSNCVPQGSKRRQYLKMVSTGEVIVNTKPHLVVFGFDDDQRMGPAWKKHKEKLLDHFGKDDFEKKRVIFRGNPGPVKEVRFYER